MAFPDPYRDAPSENAAPPPPPLHLRPVSAIQHDSQNSLAPLTANQAPQYSPSSSPTRSSDRISTPSTAAGIGAGLSAGPREYGQQLPRGHSYYGDYDSFDPSVIEDDGDDGFQETVRPRSRLGFGTAAGAAAAGTAGAAIGMKTLNRDQNGNYGPVEIYETEKSEWLQKRTDPAKRKKKWIIGCSIAAVLALGAIIGGVVGGILANQKDTTQKSGGSGSSSSSDLYDINSSQVKAVLNDDRLHKVFPAVDYTPWYAQYPACLSPGGGPTQNNVTLDIARLSQLAPAVRLYGTDCNQTELVLEAIERLQMQDTMKVWLGVYLDGNNQTTNDRQLSDLYRILDDYPHDRFVGVIVGNEVLYQKTMTVAELGTELDYVRSNLTSRGINLPVSTADLGDNWDASLVAASDIVMSNIHPFFAGTVAADAASWAWSFWQEKDVALTTSTTGTVGNLTYPKQIIAEIGWPSQGGNDCGVATDPAFGCTSDTDGAVASIDNLNTFLDGWVCDAMTNGTTYFMFEAFDEPWKHQFDTAHNGWEPYWGLFDYNRNLKTGLTIPDCGGKTVDKPY